MFNFHTTAVHRITFPLHYGILHHILHDVEIDMESILMEWTQFLSHHISGIVRSCKLG